MDLKCFLGTIGSVLMHDGVVEGGTGELNKAEEETEAHKSETAQSSAKRKPLQKTQKNVKRAGEKEDSDHRKRQLCGNFRGGMAETMAGVLSG